MTRCNRHRSSIRGRGVRTKATHQATVQTRLSINFGGVDRKALLLGTALVSTLLLGTVAAPTPAHAILTCAADVGSGLPISQSSAVEPIICVNTEPRTNAAGNAIDLSTSGAGNYINLNNSGKLTAINSMGDAYGIYAFTNDPSSITINNTGDITATSTGGGKGGGGNAFGILAESEGDDNGPVTINNSGDITATSTAGDATAFTPSLMATAKSLSTTQGTSLQRRAASERAAAVPTAFGHTSNMATAAESRSTTQVTSRRRRPPAMPTAFGPRTKAMKTAQSPSTTQVTSRRHRPTGMPTAFTPSLMTTAKSPSTTQVTSRRRRPTAKPSAFTHTSKMPTTAESRSITQVTSRRSRRAIPAERPAA